MGPKSPLPNYFWMLYVLCNKVYNFGTCKHHGTRFINFLFVKLIILCKLLLSISLFKNNILGEVKINFI
jgi:hypothetical protein